MSENFQATAEKHWEYTEDIILKVSKVYKQTISDEMMTLIKTAYVQAMCHGYKHGLQTSKTKATTEIKP